MSTHPKLKNLTARVSVSGGGVTICVHEGLGVVAEAGGRDDAIAAGGVLAALLHVDDGAYFQPAV